MTHLGLKTIPSITAGIVIAESGFSPPPMICW